MGDERPVDADDRAIATFFPVAPDAVRMCSGERGEVKPVTLFPIVTGEPGARQGECRACGTERHLSRRGSSVGDRVEKVRIRREIVTETVFEVVTAHSGCAMSTNQVFGEVFDRLEFVPSDTEVRHALRHLAKSDARCVKLGRDAYAWVPEGELPPHPPAPPHVAEMIKRRLHGLTLGEIGAEFDVTRERVRQLLKKYGGPSAEEVRAHRASEAELARRDHRLTVANAVHSALKDRGPMTVVEVVEATGFDANDVSRHWPKDLLHLRLWSAGHGDSRWSDEEILAALRAASIYEFPLTTAAYTELVRVGQIDGPSVPRIGQRFNSWSAACERAGVVAGEAWNREYESKWSDDDLLQIARAYLLDPAAPNSAHRFDEWKRENAPDGPSAPTLRNRFGSWTEVKRRALAQGDVER